MATRIKIRGIYSTGLTQLAIAGGHSVVQPSPVIRQRFALPENNRAEDILIQDRDDLQGIELIGEPERVCQFWTYLQEHLLDAALLELQPLEGPEAMVKARLEFPGETKQILDQIRLAVAPATLVRHHRLRIINSRAVERIESSLANAPGSKNSLEQQTFREMILLPLKKSGVVRLEHVRPSGKPIRPREGTIISFDHERLVFKRSFAEGRYDGLDLPIEKGDYGLTEMHEGDWFISHSYFSRNGRLRGRYYNINTPVELYPYGGRYLDLEIDIIQRPEEPPFLIDREKLSILVKEGHISSELESRALRVARDLMERSKD